MSEINYKVSYVHEGRECFGVAIHIRADGCILVKTSKGYLHWFAVNRIRIIGEE